jgi:hypothetical protein
MKRTDDERLLELEQKIEQAKAKKHQIERRMKEKERKERTRRLIQVGAIFEKYFGIEDEEEAEQVAYGMKQAVEKHKDQLKKIDVDKSKKTNQTVYKTEEETLIVPDETKDNPYKV